MKIILEGTSHKFALEQMLLTLYPNERPEYSQGVPGDDSVRVSLRTGARFVTAFCQFRRGGAVFSGRAAVAVTRMTDKISQARLEQRIIRMSFYRAALAAGHKVPSWGALTGVKPGKLMSSLLSSGLSERAAKRSFCHDFGVSPARAELSLTVTRAAREARTSLEARDVCLYVGIPFCPSRCAYCSFVSVDVTRQFILLPPYLEALDTELSALAAVVREENLRIVSAYVGGGTPTTLDAAQLARLLGRMRELFDLGSLREFTVEAGRPDTINESRIRALAECGVTRVSVNPQTMSDSVLEAIGRRHTVADVYAAVRLVRSFHQFSLNMDLIAGLPGDTPSTFRDTLEAVLTLEPENITVHTLAWKRGSRFFSEKEPLPKEESVAEMLETARTLLLQGGYEPYYLYRQKYTSGGFENVGWSKPGYKNLYNICIMEELSSVLAAGAGAVTKLVTHGGAVRRLTNPKYPKEYIERIQDVADLKPAVSAFYHESERN